MASVELGTFLVFIIVPIIGVFVAKVLKPWGLPGTLISSTLGIIGFAMVAALALFMFSEYDVVQTSRTEAHAITEEQRNSTGDLVANTTINVPQKIELTTIIDSNHYTFGWAFFGLALLLGLVYLKVIISG